jgi:hypothetical protein
LGDLIFLSWGDLLGIGDYQEGARSPKTVNHLQAM